MKKFVFFIHMFIGNDIIKLNLDLAFDSSEDEDFFESNISNELDENNYLFGKTLDVFSKKKIRKMKVNSQQNINMLINEIESNQQQLFKIQQDDKKQISEMGKNLQINASNQSQEIKEVEKNQQQNLSNQIQALKQDSIFQQQRFSSLSDELTNLSKIQFQRVTKVQKYNTNLHGFNRIGARQLFIRTVVDVNPEFNTQYVYNTGIGSHSENQNVISKVIQSTAKNMYGQEFELENSVSNPGLLEFKQNSSIYSLIPTQKQLKSIIFRDFDCSHIL